MVIQNGAGRLEKSRQPFLNDGVGVGEWGRARAEQLCGSEGRRPSADAQLGIRTWGTSSNRTDVTPSAWQKRGMMSLSGAGMRSGGLKANRGSSVNVLSLSLSLFFSLLNSTLRRQVKMIVVPKPLFVSEAPRREPRVLGGAFLPPNDSDSG